MGFCEPQKHHGFCWSKKIPDIAGHPRQVSKCDQPSFPMRRLRQTQFSLVSSSACRWTPMELSRSNLKMVIEPGSGDKMG
jgi:hypothetical protein